MLILLSPAKKLDYVSDFPTANTTQARCLEDSQTLIDQLSTYSPQHIAALMHISDDLAQLNVERFANWQRPFTLDNAKPAMFAFAGDVYAGLNALTLSKTSLDYAQSRLRILSGLYGLVRPLDLIQPYRLEMGTALQTARGTNLYQFWGSQITKILSADLQALGQAKLLNLASTEYAKSVQIKQLNTTVLTPVFKDWSKGDYKVISFFAKRARGLMARFVLDEQVTQLEQLLAFEAEGYAYNPHLTKQAQQPVFTRKIH